MHKAFWLLPYIGSLLIINLSLLPPWKVEISLIIARQKFLAFISYAFHSILTRIVQALCKVQVFSYYLFH